LHPHPTRDIIGINHDHGTDKSDGGVDVTPAGAILNGIAREKLITPVVGDQAAHAVSSVILSLLIFLVTLFVIPWFRVSKASRLWLLGLFWLSLTVAFEFLYGRFSLGLSWRKLLDDYNLLKGRLWPLVLVTTLVSPRITARIGRIS
jgi:hypothetical protein